MKRAAFSYSLIGFCCAAGAIASASPPRIAVHLDSDGTASAVILDRMLSMITGKLINTGRFQVVDRYRLNAVLREQGLSNSAYSDPNTAAALGKLAGASRLLNITVTIEVDDNAGSFVTNHSISADASYTLVGVDTARIIKAGSAQGTAQRQTPSGGVSPTSSLQLEREAIDACCDDLVAQIIEPG